MNISWTEIIILTALSGFIGQLQTLWLGHKINQLRRDLTVTKQEPPAATNKKQYRGKKR